MVQRQQHRPARRKHSTAARRHHAPPYCCAHPTWWRWVERSQSKAAKRTKLWRWLAPATTRPSGRVAVAQQPLDGTARAHHEAQQVCSHARTADDRRTNSQRSLQVSSPTWTPNATALRRQAALCGLSRCPRAQLCNTEARVALPNVIGGVCVWKTDCSERR